MQKKFIGFFLGIVVFLLIYLFADLEPGKPEVTATLAVAASSPHQPTTRIC